jgi:hypothetical protein
VNSPSSRDPSFLHLLYNTPLIIWRKASLPQSATELLHFNSISDLSWLHTQVDNLTTHLVKSTESEPLSHLSTAPNYWCLYKDQLWLRKWIAINVSKAWQCSSHTGESNPLDRLPPSVSQSCWLTHTVIWMWLDKRLTWSTHIDLIRKKSSLILGVVGPLLSRKSGLSITNGILLFRQLCWIMRAPSGGPLRDAMSENCRYFKPCVFTLLLVPLGTWVTGKFTRIREFNFSSTTSEP